MISVSGCATTEIHECVWTEKLEFTDPTIEVMTALELNQVVSHNMLWSKYCKE